MPARVQYTFTFTNGDPDEPVTFDTDRVYASATGAQVGRRMELDAAGTVRVWSDAATLTASTVDGQGLPLVLTATRDNATLTNDEGTAPPNAEPNAGGVAYDNTTSELTATDVQAAIDELTVRVAALETP